MRYRTLNPVLRMIKRLLASSLLLLACTGLVSSETPSLLERIQAEGRLTILSRNGPTTYYEGPHGMTGFEYTLAKAFAEELGVELHIEEEGNLGLLIDSIGGPRGEIGASGLTVTERRMAKVRFSEAYMDVTQELIYNRLEDRPRSVENLIGKDILVIANSSHAERLRELQREHPDLRWRERNDLEMIDLVELVHNGSQPYAVVDSNAFAINSKVYPSARAAFAISEPQQLAWAFPKMADSSLFDAAQDFFSRIKENGRLADVTEHFYGNMDKVNEGGARLFAERVRERLPNWEGYLRTAGEQYGLDWLLLAAMSYQESHWDSKARSHTGVRGLMMLTLVTARELGIANRIDPQQSIDGGARYLRQIYDRLPGGVQGADRTWMALAAYNVGTGHLEDARILTQSMGGDPDQWSDVERHLPLLAKRKYYQHARHGYARGWEPVAYVQHIRQYYNILRWQEEQTHRRVAVTDIEQLYPTTINVPEGRVSLSQ